MDPPDIFISYAREDEAWVRPLAAEFAQSGRSVFWDRRIPAGQSWRSHIGKALKHARCVVVVWSAPAIESDWVIEEADQGKQRGVLVPVLREAVQPPFGFGHIQAADLSTWSSGVPTPALNALMSDLEAILGPSKCATTEIAIDHGPATLVGISVSKDRHGPTADAPQSTPEPLSPPSTANAAMPLAASPNLTVEEAAAAVASFEDGASAGTDIPTRPAPTPSSSSRWTRLIARPSTKDARESSRKRSARWLASLALFATGVIGVGVYTFTRPSPAPPPATAASLEHMLQSTVRVLCKQGDGKFFSGPGFVVGEDLGTYVVTNDHVISCSDSIHSDNLSIMLASNTLVPARAVWGDSDTDLAILRTTQLLGRPAAQLADTASLKAGEPINQVGFPDINTANYIADTADYIAVPWVTRGNISRITSVTNGMRYFQHTAPAIRGASGGPVYDDAGDVIAVNLRKVSSLATLDGGEMAPDRVANGEGTAGNAFAIDVRELIRPLKAEGVPYVMAAPFARK